VSNSLAEQLATESADWKAAGLQRMLAPPEGVDFTSSDYLGLARDPRVIAAARAALEEYGAGACGARLLRGNLPPHESAERACAGWLGEEAALLFPSGWQANAALLPAVAGADDLILSDERNHASLIDGARLARARRVVFRHNDLDDLAARLGRARAARRRIVVVEDVYSMDGDLAPLGALLRLCEEHDAHLVVDHAHAAGLYEDRLPAAHPRVLARVVTGGKALGAAGAFVAGRRTMVDLLLNKGRAFVYTTAPAPATAAALEAAIRILRSEPDLSAPAHANATRLRELLRAGGLEARGDSPIVPVMIGAADRAMEVAAAVRARGFDVRAIRPPTVPEGSSRLRLVCHAAHTPEQIDGVAEAIITAVRASAARAEPPALSNVRVKPAPRLIVIAGTDTDVGKTVVSALLVRALLAAQQPVGYFKPVQCGPDDDTARVMELSGLSVEHAPRPAFSLTKPASVDQAAAGDGVEVNADKLLVAIGDTVTAIGRKKQQSCWLIECAGGLRVPLNAHEDQSDLLRRLGAPVVLVARSGLGTLNHTLLSLEALETRRLRAVALFLVGPPHPENVRTLAGRHPDLPLLELPQFRMVDAAALDLWLSAHQLPWLLQDFQNASTQNTSATSFLTKS
jgi:8-amino-7-oxononanoate synthase